MHYLIFLNHTVSYFDLQLIWDEKAENYLSDYLSFTDYLEFYLEFDKVFFNFFG